MLRAERSARLDAYVRSRHRPGFTLIEVLVALMITGLVLLGARLLLENLGSQAEHIANVAVRGNVDANGERLLRGVVARLEVGSAAVGTFGGDEHATTFTSWCETWHGWQERCRVRLAIVSNDSGGADVALVVGSEQVIVARARRDAMLRYLADASSGGIWIIRWGEGLTAPRALGLVIDGDTTILRIGERG